MFISKSDYADRTLSNSMQKATTMIFFSKWLVFIIIYLFPFRIDAQMHLSNIFSIVMTSNATEFTVIFFA